MATPAPSGAAKVYYCGGGYPGGVAVRTGQWCSKNDFGNPIPKRPYWLQVGCYPKAPSRDCRSSDYSSCIDYNGSELRIVVQAITSSLQQRYSASGCNLAGWYHPENTVNVLPLMTHLYTGADSLYVKGWACYGGNPYSLTC